MAESLAAAFPPGIAKSAKRGVRCNMESSSDNEPGMELIATLLTELPGPISRNVGPAYRFSVP